jgi:ABC-2 type transport system permease protein
VTGNALVQMATLGRRAVVRTARQPANVVFPLIFPMLLLAVNAGGLKAATNLPGFPTNSFLAFALAVPFVQGALLATINANVEFARDVQTGFLNRLALTPVRALVLLVGQLGGLLTIALVQAAFYLAVGLAFGVRLESGVAGAGMLLLLEVVIALAFASLGSWAALRTGSTEAVQSLFPVFFVFLFMS